MSNSTSLSARLLDIRIVAGRGTLGAAQYKLKAEDWGPQVGENGLSAVMWEGEGGWANLLTM